MIVQQSGGKVTVLAPAKLNLFLEVLGRRADGFHEIETVMVAVDLFDELTFVEDTTGSIRLDCDDPTLPTGPANLVVRAAEALRAELGVDRGVSIGLRKAIPAQAGLAGGSSDAAATLAGLDRLWDLGLDASGLGELGSKVGSDVPFFFRTPAAACRGRGERVEPLAIEQPFHFVLVTPGVGVSTASVYRHLNVPDRPRPIGPTLDALRQGDTPALGRSLFNRLQPVAEDLEPALVPVRQALTSLGPSLDGSLMSGSGSAYFGLARDRSAADAAAQQLETLGLGRVRVVTCGP